MKVRDEHIMELLKWFEDTLNRATKVDRKDKMKMRKKVRDELFLLLTWEKPTADAIMNRWEERLYHVFSAFPFGAKEELFSIMKKIMASPKG